MRYALASQDVYTSIQGEGALLGEPMIFIRLAGCSIGCPQCDTNYSVARRSTPEEIAHRAAKMQPRWVWITGGEPTDRDLDPLAVALKASGKLLAIATAGTRSLSPGLWDWISISPHVAGRPKQWTGHEVKLVPGLNGLDLADCDPRDYLSFTYRYVIPLHNDAKSFAVAIAWADKHPGWRLGVQAHKQWGLK